MHAFWAPCGPARPVRPRLGGGGGGGRAAVGFLPGRLLRPAPVLPNHTGGRRRAIHRRPGGRGVRGGVCGGDRPGLRLRDGARHGCDDVTMLGGSGRPGPPVCDGDNRQLRRVFTGDNALNANYANNVWVMGKTEACTAVNAYLCRFIAKS